MGWLAGNGGNRPRGAGCGCDGDAITTPTTVKDLTQGLSTGEYHDLTKQEMPEDQEYDDVRTDLGDYDPEGKVMRD